MADVWIENIVPLASDAPPPPSTALFVTALRLVTGGTTDPTTGTFMFDGEPYQPVVLLTRSPLPATPPIRLWLHGQPVMMQAEAVGGGAAIDVDAERLERLFGYTLRCLRAVTNRAFLSTAHKMAWFVAPVVRGGEIDWAAVSVAALEKEVPLDPYDVSELSTDSVIVDRAKNNARYYFVRTRYDLNPRAWAIAKLELKSQCRRPKVASSTAALPMCSSVRRLVAVRVIPACCRSGTARWQVSERTS